MAIFTKQFADHDDYEEWLAHASDRINVLSIGNAPTIFGSSMVKPGGPVIVKYQTHDQTLAPQKGLAGKAVEVAIVGAAFFALFAYLIAEL